MSEYRKKALVEARQLTRENWPELLAWIEAGKQYIDADGAVDGLTIFTLEGRMKADFGDWIIKGVQGEFYPCKDEIFKATYEPADVPAAPEIDLDDLSLALAAVEDAPSGGTTLERYSAWRRVRKAVERATELAGTEAPDA